MKKFLYKQREIMAILVFVGIIAALVYFAIFPLMGRIDAVNNQMQEEKAKQENIAKQISELPKIKQQYATLEKNQDLTNILLDKNEAVFLIEKLEKLSDETNNKITISIQDAPTVDPKKTVTKGKNDTEKNLIDDLPSKDFLQMRITLDGNYNSIANFVKSLEDFEYYADITALQVSKSDLQGSQTRIAATVGTLNPFNASAGNSSDQKDNEMKSDALTAALDTVFYTRK